jgi:serine/threonine protein kinase
VLVFLFKVSYFHVVFGVLQCSSPGMHFRASSDGCSALACAQFNFMSQPRNRLRERFPPLTHDGRNALSGEGYALLSGLLQLDPSRRLTAEEALSHRWCALRLFTHDSAYPYFGPNPKLDHLHPTPSTLSYPPLNSCRQG